MSHRILFSLIAVLTLMVAACAGDQPVGVYDFDDTSYQPDQPMSTEMAINFAHLEGAIGSFTDINHDAAPHFYNDKWYSEFYFNVANPNQAAMSALFLTGDLRDFLNIRGEQHFSLQDAQNYYGGSEIVMTGIGCEGPSTDMWSYDEPADEVIALVDEVPGQDGVYTINYTAIFPSRPAPDNSVDGSFEVTMPRF